MTTVIQRLYASNQTRIVLEKFNHAFPRSISSRVNDLDGYAEKLATYGIVLVAVEGDATVGFAAFYANDERGKTAYLTQLAVEGQSRGRGIAMRLMGACMEISRNCGMTRMKLEVDNDNNKAIQFYVRLGFEPCGAASPVSCYMKLDDLAR